VEDQSGPIPEEITSKPGKCFYDMGVDLEESRIVHLYKQPSMMG
jgi:hypothetical protein